MFFRNISDQRRERVPLGDRQLRGSARRRMVSLRRRGPGRRPRPARRRALQLHPLLPERRRRGTCIVRARHGHAQGLERRADLLGPAEHPQRRGHRLRRLPRPADRPPHGDDHALRGGDPRRRRNPPLPAHHRFLRGHRDHRRLPGDHARREHHGARTTWTRTATTTSSGETSSSPASSSSRTPAPARTRCCGARRARGRSPNRWRLRATTPPRSATSTATATWTSSWGSSGGAFNPNRSSVDNLHLFEQGSDGAFTEVTRRLIRAVDVGSESYPAFNDLDGDGDLDLLLSNKIDFRQRPHRAPLRLREHRIRHRTRLHERAGRCRGSPTRTTTPPPSGTWTATATTT